MEKAKIYVFLFDGFSDWEIAYLTSEINRNELADLIFFSKDDKPIKSMGGLTVVPDEALKNINPDNIDLLVLPGGTHWEKGLNNEIESLTRKVADLDKPIAAICAATTFLGQLGLLNETMHTSNDLNYLKAIAPNYAGEVHYQASLSVSDKKLITANGIAPIEFTREILKMMGLYNEEELNKWYQLYKHGIWEE